jgi:hypothetical protein
VYDHLNNKNKVESKDTKKACDNRYLAEIPVADNHAPEVLTQFFLDLDMTFIGSESVSITCSDEVVYYKIILLLW